MSIKVTQTIRNVIFKLRRAGYSLRQIRDYIKENFELDLSHSTINYHLNYYYRKKAQIRSQENYQKKRYGDLIDIKSNQQEVLRKIFPWLYE